MSVLWVVRGLRVDHERHLTGPSVLDLYVARDTSLGDHGNHERGDGFPVSSGK